MKVTWGTGIFIFIILFLIACGIFMWFAFSQKLNLVHDDYYERGVNHSVQMEIDRASAEFQNQIYLIENKNNVTVYFPDHFNEDISEGSILFFRPSDNSLDVDFEMNIENNKQLIDKKKLISGRYLVKIAWTSDRKYYIEKEFFLE